MEEYSRSVPPARRIIAIEEGSAQDTDTDFSFLPRFPFHADPPPVDEEMPQFVQWTEAPALGIHSSVSVKNLVKEAFEVPAEELLHKSVSHGNRCPSLIAELSSEARVGADGQKLYREHHLQVVFAADAARPIIRGDTNDERERRITSIKTTGMCGGSFSVRNARKVSVLVAPSEQSWSRTQHTITAIGAFSSSVSYAIGAEHDMGSVVVGPVVFHHRPDPGSWLRVEAAGELNYEITLEGSTSMLIVVEHRPMVTDIRMDLSDFTAGRVDVFRDYVGMQPPAHGISPLAIAALVTTSTDGQATSQRFVDGIRSVDPYFALPPRVDAPKIARPQARQQHNAAYIAQLMQIMHFHPMDCSFSIFGYHPLSLRSKDSGATCHIFLTVDKPAALYPLGVITRMEEALRVHKKLAMDDHRAFVLSAYVPLAEEEAQLRQIMGTGSMGQGNSILDRLYGWRALSMRAYGGFSTEPTIPAEGLASHPMIDLDLLPPALILHPAQQRFPEFDPDISYEVHSGETGRDPFMRRDSPSFFLPSVEPEHNEERGEEEQLSMVPPRTDGWIPQVTHSAFMQEKVASGSISYFTQFASEETRQWEDSEEVVVEEGVVPDTVPNFPNYDGTQMDQENPGGHVDDNGYPGQLPVHDRLAYHDLPPSSPYWMTDPTMY